LVGVCLPAPQKRATGLVCRLVGDSGIMWAARCTFIAVQPLKSRQSPQNIKISSVYAILFIFQVKQFNSIHLYSILF
jgi:hypothetical protein